MYFLITKLKNLKMAKRKWLFIKMLQKTLGVFLDTGFHKKTKELIRQSSLMFVCPLVSIALFSNLIFNYCANIALSKVGIVRNFKTNLK